MAEWQILCKRCRRPLKDARSIAVGMGPTCEAKEKGLYRLPGAAQDTKTTDMFDEEEEKEPWDDLPW